MRELLAAAFSLIAATAWAQPLVVATTPDLKAIVDAVSGGTVRTAALTPAGADAEAFEPRPSHLGLVREAELVVRVGLGYDGWLEPLLARVDRANTAGPARRYVDLSKAVALLESKAAVSSRRPAMLTEQRTRTIGSIRLTARSWEPSLRMR